MSVVVVATIIPRPEHRDAAIAAYTETIPAVHAEAGCELHALHRGEGRLMMIEKWAGREALGAHSRGAALAALKSQPVGKLIGPAEVIVLEAVPAGDPGTGRL